MLRNSWAALPAIAQSQHAQAGLFAASPRHHALPIAKLSEPTRLWAFRCHPCREGRFHFSKMMQRRHKRDACARVGEGILQYQMTLFFLFLEKKNILKGCMIAESVCKVLTSMIVPSIVFLSSLSAFTLTKEVTLSIDGRLLLKRDW